MQREEQWKQRDGWTWREFVALLILEFGFVIFVVKHGVQSLYEKWFVSSLYAGTLTGLTIAIVLLTGLYVIALRPRRQSWKEVGLRSFPAKDGWRIVSWFLILTALSIAAVVITGYFGNTVENSKTEALKEQVTWFTVLLGVLSAGFVSPVYEEIFYRGFMYRWLRTRTGIVWGIVISSLIFTAAHYPTLNAMPVNFISGVIFAWAYERTGSVIPGMIVHGMFNTIAVLLTAFG
ncbi:CAAX amino terminal protease [Paenibacillus sp. 32O-W]|jgi:membrane protease YdiL (CAAX protease family)|uniref:CAAX amino protease n=1 Tax=Paenibacillus cisolokensis TaxID=1658519 RepID=A0ABQ4N5H3_9BACL|nr:MULTISPECIES: type II CAAX endopeptidase family protein [Paenibacillus]ALS29590.1 CAAX amino terminal protease [Paenibacillus sp. 32O-W]GIQ63410.1 CAAX amino protease [Paenibacillus cisolokensis]